MFSGIWLQASLVPGSPTVSSKLKYYSLSLFSFSLKGLALLLLCLWLEFLVALCLYHPKNFIRRKSLFILSSKENPRIKSYWPDLRHVFIPEPLSPVWIECADWLSLNCLPTKDAGLGEDTAPLKWEEISNQKSGFDLRKKNGTWHGRVNSYSPQSLPTKIHSLEGRKVCLCVGFLCIQLCVHVHSEKSLQQATPS